MSIVSSTGIGSGVDIQSIVTQLVKAEGQPQFNAINRQKQTANTRLSGLGTLKSALSDFQAAVKKLKDGNLYKSLTATSSDESVVKVTAKTGSVAGSHTIEVIKLAQRTKLNTSALNPSSKIMGGKLTFASTDPSKAGFEINLDYKAAGDYSMEELRDKVNSAAGNTYVTASIVYSGSEGSREPSLILTANNTGLKNGFTVTAEGDTVLNGLFSAGTYVPADDAGIVIDGKNASSSSNSITDVLPGVTLDLVKAGTSELNVSLDNETISKTFGEFVSAYNKLQSTVKDLSKYGGSTDGSGSGNGPLIGDSTLRYISTQIRQTLTKVIPYEHIPPGATKTDKETSLPTIGIKIDKSGTMSLDSAKLNTYLGNNPELVSYVFSSIEYDEIGSQQIKKGMATNLDDVLSSFLQSGGPLDSQQSALKTRISTLDKRTNDVQARLDQMQKALQKQFTAMDVSVGRFNSTGSFLAGWIKNQ